MNYTILFLCFIAAVSACVHDDGNGQPLCNGKTTLVGNQYRNNWDPTAYWLCESLNKPVLVRCPTATLYFVVKDTCVTSGVWRWTLPCKPDV